MDNFLEVNNLSFHYHETPILDGVSFSVKAGDYVGLVGPNGAGKSTLIKIILGLLPLQFGEIKLFGTPIQTFNNWDAMGYVPQYVFRTERNFPATVREVVESGHLDQSSFWCQVGLAQCHAIDEALLTTGITHLLGRRIGELSGGELQRVFIARALVSRPRLLILDEPTAGVDSQAQTEFYALLRKLNEKEGLAIILISHDLEVVAHETKTALCLNRSIVYTGPSEALHSEEVIMKLFGERVRHHYE